MTRAHQVWITPALSLKTADLARVGNSAPVDGLAARQIRGGINFVSSKKIQQVHSDTPIVCKPVPKDVQDFTRTRRGRLTVWGYLEKATTNGHGPLWLVRCDCGQYEARRAKALKGANALKPDGCQQCCQLAYLRKSEHFRRTGRDLPLAEAWR